MPRGKKATGRATSSSSLKATKQQSSLSFAGGRVTKPSANTRSASGKHAAEKAAALEQSLSGASTPHAIDSPVTPADSPSAAEDQPAPHSPLAIRELPSVAPAVAPENKPAEDIEASHVTDKQIRSYWAGKEAERTTKRVHQEGLSLHEKILREFDMSSQYGPCIGVSRTRRWRLARELGLEPPIEVLGVLLKEEEGAEGEQEKTKVQRAYVDELMAGRFVVD